MTAWNSNFNWQAEFICFYGPLIRPEIPFLNLRPSKTCLITVNGRPDQQIQHSWPNQRRPRIQISADRPNPPPYRCLFFGLISNNSLFSRIQKSWPAEVWLLLFGFYKDTEDLFHKQQKRETGGSMPFLFSACY